MSEALAARMRAAARELTGGREDFDPLLDWIGDAQFVLIGEATHGSHEFYRERARLTRRLITEKGFAGVAIEGDWPDAVHVHRHVRGESHGDALGALNGFRRFPEWMWRNQDVLDFVNWLRATNDDLPAGAPRAGFYGLDLYGLYASIEAVLDYLGVVDPEAAQRARYRYACFDHIGEDPHAVGYAAAFDLSAACEEGVLRQLQDLRAHREQYLALDGPGAADAFFDAEQNARLVRNAEAYYRGQFRGRVSSWNLRDAHMHESLEALADHARRQGRPDRFVVWAHNSHVGDARATEMGWGGEHNLGQLLRARVGRAVYSVGLTTYAGTVTAADDWGAAPRTLALRPALPDSFEAVFHATGLPQFLLDLRDGGVRDALAGERLERAVGVIYRPQTERLSHYFHARLSEQFDALIHLDETHALAPLDARATGAQTAEPAETYPTGL